MADFRDLPLKGGRQPLKGYLNTLATACKVAINEANLTSSLQGYPDGQREGHMPTEGPCEKENRNQL